MTAIGPEFYNFIKALEDNGDKLTGLSPYEQPLDFEYHNATCYVCNGYYGPNFGEPVCGTCHTFLFPDFPSYLPTSYFCSEKTDDGDSGNDEPSDLNYSSDRKVKLPAWWYYRNSLDSETSPEDEASRASNSGPGASSSGSGGCSSGGLGASGGASIPGCSGSVGVSRSSAGAGVPGGSGIVKSSGVPKISTGVGLPGSSGIIGLSKSSAVPGGSGVVHSHSYKSPIGVGMSSYSNAGVGVAGGSNGSSSTGIPRNFIGMPPAPVGSEEVLVTIGSGSDMVMENVESLESMALPRSTTSLGVPQSAGDCTGTIASEITSDEGGPEDVRVCSGIVVPKSTTGVGVSDGVVGCGETAVPQSSSSTSLTEDAGGAVSSNVPRDEESAGQGPPPPPPNLARSLQALSTPRPLDNLAPGLVEQLPSEVLLCIFRYLDDLSLCACSCVCARWWRLVRARVPPPRWAAFTTARWPLYRRLARHHDWHKKYLSLVESCFCRNCLVQMCAQAQPAGEENAWRRNRLRIELKMLRNDPPEGIAATPLDPKCCHWQASVSGPVGSPYEGGVFYLYIQVPYSYPMSPPVVRFLTRILHPNVSRHGDVGIDSVHHNWSLALTISKVLISIQSLLTDPYTAVCMEPELGDMYVRDRARFESLARRWTWRYAMLDILPY